jgi:endonuclease/exonuclease/phosphatase (EEP) superfamily protein YafD
MRASGIQIIRPLKWLGLLTSLATTISFYDTLWVFELFTHFTVQYLLILFLLTTVFLLLRQYKFMIVFALFFSVNLYKTLDQSLLVTASTAQVSNSIKVVTLNVDLSSTRYSMTLDFLQDSGADILLLTELTPEWSNKLNSLETIYPYSYRVPKKGGFGIALFSRFPMSNSKAVTVDSTLNPAIVSDIDINGTRVTVKGVHLFAPMTNSYFHARNRQLEKLAELVTDRNSPAIVLGDFNITSWSSHFRRFIETTSLRKSTSGHGFQPTWPSYFFPLYIQLDHILISEEFYIIRSKSGKYVGSDHYPLIAEISFTKTIK